jgi:hypothetical protein
VVARKRNDDKRDERQAEFLTSEREGKGIYFGPGYPNGTKVDYVVINGWAIAEGDILLGTAEELKKSNDPEYQEKMLLDEAARESATVSPETPLSAGFVADTRYRWPNCTMFYEIDPNLPNQIRITDAMNHWTQKTGFKFVKRTTQANYVYFTDLGGCWSKVGMRGNKQELSLSSACSTGNTIHEIGHAIGLYHEQQRNDRDSWIRINWANIIPSAQSNFYQYLSSGKDVGEYDYCSIMHYPRTAFSIPPGNLETITPLKAGAECMGQRTGLSPKDIQAVKQEYPQCAIGQCAGYLKDAKNACELYKRTGIKIYRCICFRSFAKYYCCRARQNPNFINRLLCKVYSTYSNRFCGIFQPPPIPGTVTRLPDPMTGIKGEQTGLDEEMLAIEGIEGDELFHTCLDEMQGEIMEPEMMQGEIMEPEMMEEEIMEPEMMEEEIMEVFGTLTPRPSPDSVIPLHRRKGRTYRLRAKKCLELYRTTGNRKYACCYFANMTRYYYCCKYE